MNDIPSSEASTAVGVQKGDINLRRAEIKIEKHRSRLVNIYSLFREKFTGDPFIFFDANHNEIKVLFRLGGSSNETMYIYHPLANFQIHRAGGVTATRKEGHGTLQKKGIRHHVANNMVKVLFADLEMTLILETYLRSLGLLDDKGVKGVTGIREKMVEKVGGLVGEE